MTPRINADQARDIYGRLSRTLCSGDTWRGRAFEMRVAFDLLLNYATNGEIGRSGGFWETAINTMNPTKYACGSTSCSILSMPTATTGATRAMTAAQFST